MRTLIVRDAKLGLALAAPLLLAACDRKPEALPPVIRPVLSLVVQPATAQPARGFTGTVEPRYEAQLGFQMAGRMISRNANVGDRVTKGEPLATLDPTVARLAVASAEADLVNAQGQLTNAAATYARQAELFKTASVSQAQVDTAVASRDTAQARVAQAEASLRKSREQLGYATLTSDYDGVITQWSAEVGQVVSASQSVVTVARPDARDAVFDIPDTLVGRFLPGTSAKVTLLADEALSVTGEVREIAPQADAATGTRRIRITLRDPAPAFRLGTTVRILMPAQGEPAIALPASTIVETEGRTSVWLVGPDGKITSRPVTIAHREDGAMTIASGLAAGDRVVTAGVHSLSEGQVVKTSEPQDNLP